MEADGFQSWPEARGPATARISANLHGAVLRTEGPLPIKSLTPVVGMRLQKNGALSTGSKAFVSGFLAYLLQLQISQAAPPASSIRS
jgi:hypothetical protein